MTDRSGQGLEPDERAELERLRAEVTALREHESAQAAAPRSGSRWRTVISTVMIAIGCVLLLPATVALWLDSVVTDTDRYVTTVAPLADDAAVQDAVSRRVTAEVVAAVDVEDLVDQIADGLSDRGVRDRATTALRGLSGPLSSGVEGWIADHVDQVVRSDTFADIWARANRAAHTQIVRLLTEGESGGALVASGDAISLDVGPVVEAVKQRLVDSGVGLADRIPEIDTQIVLVETTNLDAARSGFALVNGLGVVLPIVALVLVIAGVLVAPDRRRALIKAGIGATAAMIALGVLLAVARPVYTNAIPPDVDTAASLAVFDQVLVFLRTTLRSVLVAGVVVAVAAFLTGPSRAAVSARGALGRVGGEMDRRHWRDNPVSGWLGRHKSAVQIGIVIAAVLVFVFWDYPTGAVVATIALVAAAVAVAVEIIAAPELPRVE